MTAMTIAAMFQPLEARPQILQIAAQLVVAHVDPPKSDVFPGNRDRQEC
jgi:hypothetical protein